MAALAYRDDKILARNLLSHPFFCLTPAEPFFRPDRSSIAPSCRVAVKDGRAFRGHPKGLSLTAASTMARWLYRSGRRSCVAAEHASSPRRSSRLPGSRSRSLYRSPGTPIGKSIDYLDFATIKLPAPAYRDLDEDSGGDEESESIYPLTEGEKEILRRLEDHLERHLEREPDPKFERVRQVLDEDFRDKRGASGACDLVSQYYNSAYALGEFLVEHVEK